MTVRYEDFVDDPEAALDLIFEFAGVERRADRIFGPGPLFLQGGHSVSGNPRRLDRKPVELRIDDGWERALDPRHRTLVGRLSRPFLARYQYPRDT